MAQIFKKERIVWMNNVSDICDKDINRLGCLPQMNQQMSYQNRRNGSNVLRICKEPRNIANKIPDGHFTLLNNENASSQIIATDSYRFS